jgi:hypothetical protein
VSELTLKLKRVLDFINSTSVPPDEAKSRLLLNGCITSFMNYGTKLFDIEERERRRQRAGGQKLRPGLMPTEELMKLPATRRLNNDFDCSSFEAATHFIDNGSAKFQMFDLRPPVFFDYSVTTANESGRRSVFDFLNICRHVDPRRWAKCDNTKCGRIFVRVRRRPGAAYCSDSCRRTAQSDARSLKSAAKQTKGGK